MCGVPGKARVQLGSGRVVAADFSQRRKMPRGLAPDIEARLTRAGTDPAGHGQM
jgi:hypothetical protein